MDSLTPMHAYTDNMTTVRDNISVNSPAETNNAKVPDDIIPEVTPSDTTTESTLTDKALLAAGLPKNDKNVTIIQELLRNNMSIDKRSIVNILTQSIANKEVSLGTLISMNKAGIPVSADNAKNMEAYINGEHKIVEQIDSLTHSMEISIKDTSDPIEVLRLNTTYTEPIKSTFQSVQPELSSHEASVLDVQNTSTDNELLVQSSFTSENDAKTVINILNLFGNGEEIASKISDGTATLSETAQALNKSLEQAVIMELENAYNTSESGVKAQDLFNMPSVQNILRNYSRIQNNNNELSSYMDESGRNAINSMIKDIPSTQALSDEIRSGNISSKELIVKLNELFTQIPAKDAAHIIKSDEYLTILKHALTGEWTLTPDEI